jgi:hypothetical protein
LQQSTATTCSADPPVCLGLASQKKDQSPVLEMLLLAASVLLMELLLQVAAAQMLPA